MEINDILTIMPPPKVPISVPSDDDWMYVESLGYMVPDDLRIFLAKYGVGCINSFLWVFSPISPNRYLNLVEQTKLQKDLIEESIDSGNLLEPKSEWFHGLRYLVFAISDNGDICCYHNESVYVFEPRSPDVQVIHCPIIEFIGLCITGGLKIDAFPDSFLDDKPNYVHYIKPMPKGHILNS